MYGQKKVYGGYQRGKRTPPWELTRVRARARERDEEDLSNPFINYD